MILLKTKFHRHLSNTIHRSSTRNLIKRRNPINMKRISIMVAKMPTKFTSQSRYSIKKTIMVMKKKSRCIPMKPGSAT